MKSNAMNECQNTFISKKKLGGITNESTQICCVCAFFFSIFHVIIFRFENETKSKEVANRIFKKKKEVPTINKLGINQEKDPVK